VREGRDPPGVIRDPAKNQLNIVATFGVIPASLHWNDHCEELLAKAVIRLGPASAES